MDKHKAAERLRVRIASNTDRIRRAQFQREQLASKIEFYQNEAKRLKEELGAIK